MDSGNAAWKHSLVIGLSEDPVEADVMIFAQAAANDIARIGIGLDSASSFATPNNIIQLGGGVYGVMDSKYRGYPGIGYHYLQGLNATDSVAAATFYTVQGTNFRSGMFSLNWA
jgi:hypothetical protein